MLDGKGGCAGKDKASEYSDTFDNAINSVRYAFQSAGKSIPAM